MFFFTLLREWVGVRRLHILHRSLCFFRGPTPYSGEDKVMSEFVGFVLVIVTSIRTYILYIQVILSIYSPHPPPNRSRLATFGTLAE